MTIKAVYDKGIFRPTEPVQLEDGTKVEVLVVPDPTKAAEFFRRIAATADRAREPKDNLCGSRDHDAIIYRNDEASR